MIAFAKHPRKDRTDCAARRHWYTRDRGYRVTESVSLFGLPTVYYAMRLEGHTWSIISRHRKRHAAEVAVARAARRET